MEENMTIGGIKIPRADWEKTPDSVRNLVRSQEQRITTIEERLGLNEQLYHPLKTASPGQTREERQGERT
jgi:hypothetical protein